MTSVAMSTAMGLFALAIAGDLVVIGWLATDSWVIAIVNAVVAASVFAVMWFVYPLRVRAAGRAER